jgi:carboxylesterase type B
VLTSSSIRYAAPPIGQNRWQAPQPPEENITPTIPANTAPPRCPQAGNAPFSPYDWRGDEDCLFLNVYAPEDAKDLPVFVWIHGGGYGGGHVNQFPISIVQKSEGQIVGVGIQYRLGAFGFLASEDVKQHGTLNSGLLDQQFALQWVQKYIHSFGGNASQVTIGGQSAGAGSALLHAIDSGENESSTLFSNIIAASPYLPHMHRYNDAIPSHWYSMFVETAGCGELRNDRRANALETFDCLLNMPSEVLQRANAMVSASGPYGSWAFVPVLDGMSLDTSPGQQLKDANLRGRRVLSGNVANEGPAYVPQNISSENDLMSWLRLIYPLISADDISGLLRYYPADDIKTPSANSVRYATDGINGATALTTSAFATGNQQIANNIYAEGTFICPSYWLVEAFASDVITPEVAGRASYQYQYSVPAGQHGADLDALYGSSEDRGLGPDLSGAFQLSWANFVIYNNPSIPVKHANGRALGMGKTGAERLAEWPRWQTNGDRAMVNWNQTGGEEVQTSIVQGAPQVGLYKGDRLRNWLNVHDAWNWEGGRGERCEFWRNVTSEVSMQR